MEPFIAQIVMFGGNFAPRGWAFCDGQLLSISQNTALYSLLGTTYGGDGRTTFALPDLRGRTPIGPRTGNGLPTYREGQMVGAPSHTLSQLEMPAHTHQADTSGLQILIGADNSPGDTNTPSSGVTLAAPPKAGPTDVKIYKTNGNPATPINGGNGLSGKVNIGVSGGSQPISLMQPSLAINFIIALVGVFPSRN
jgi:microcystin-dependent protein